MRKFQITALLLASSTALLAATACGQKSASANDDVAGAQAGAPAAEPQSGSITITKKWTMPPELLEISGISWMDDQRIACVQDERGSLFIYNLSSSRVEKEIAFAGPGDYEAVSKAGNHFFVMRADGHLYELDPAAASPVVKEWNAVWPGKHDIEAMSYDAAGKRLLVADKMGNGGSRGIYAFDLSTGKMGSTPVYEIAMDDAAPAGDEGGGKKKDGKKKGNKKENKKGGASLQPSGMATNPVTGEIYIADGPKARLLVFDPKGKEKRVIQLDKKDFPQPEGLSVSPQGEIYLSSEGVKGAGVIARITL